MLSYMFNTILRMVSVALVVSAVVVVTESAGELAIHSFLPETCVSTGKEEMVLLTGKLPKGKLYLNPNGGLSISCRWALSIIYTL